MFLGFLGIWPIWHAPSLCSQLASARRRVSAQRSQQALPEAAQSNLASPWRHRGALQPLHLKLTAP